MRIQTSILVTSKNVEIEKSWRFYWTIYSAQFSLSTDLDIEGIEQPLFNNAEFFWEESSPKSSDCKRSLLDSAETFNEIHRLEVSPVIGYSS